MLIEIEISSALHIMIPCSEKNLTGDQWDVCEGARVVGILDILSLSDVPTLLIVNGEVVREDRILKERDTLKIFPMVSGG